MYNIFFVGEKNAKVEEYYAEMGLLPIYTSDEFKYIPSFVDLLAQTEDERILRFIKFHWSRNLGVNPEKSVFFAGCKNKNEQFL